MVSLMGTMTSSVLRATCLPTGPGPLPIKIFHDHLNFKYKVFFGLCKKLLQTKIGIVGIGPLAHSHRLKSFYNFLLL